MSTFAYARVSSVDQNLDRQIEALSPFVSDERYLITDKASGKDFNRRGWLSLVGSEHNLPLLHEDDLLVILSLDRLGRNYEQIRENWNLVTQTLKANIKVLDMPLLDTTTSKGSLDGRFIADLVLQILSYTAQKERESNKFRQKAGIEAAHKADAERGVSRFGRPKVQKPTEWEPHLREWQSGNITAIECMRRCGNIKPTKFYRIYNQFFKK